MTNTHCSQFFVGLAFIIHYYCGLIVLQLYYCLVYYFAIKTIRGSDALIHRKQADSQLIARTASDSFFLSLNIYMFLYQTERSIEFCCKNKKYCEKSKKKKQINENNALADVTNSLYLANNKAVCCWLVLLAGANWFNACFKYWR